MIVSLSSYSYQCDNRRPFLFPSEPTLFPNRVGSLSLTNLGILLLFLSPVGSSSSSCIHTCITSTHGILGSKNWCTLYLTLFGPSNQRFHLQVSVRRNLNRGICHTPIFDPNFYFFVFRTSFFRRFKQNFGREVFENTSFLWFRRR